MAAVELVCVLMGEPATTLSHWEVSVLGKTGSKLGQEGWDPPEGSPCPPSICVQMDAIGNTRCERQ